MVVWGGNLNTDDRRFQLALVVWLSALIIVTSVFDAYQLALLVAHSG